MKIGVHETAHGPAIGAELDMRDIDEWPATIQQLRPVIEAGLIVAPHVQADFISLAQRQMSPTPREIDHIAKMTQDAFAAGRVMVFGYLPNDVIKMGGARGGPLYARGALGVPFVQPWVLHHTWEHGTGLYIVNALEPDRPAGGDIELAELTPVVTRKRQEHFLVVGDRCVYEPADEDDGKEWGNFNCRACPSIWRFLPGASEINGGSPEGAAASNLLDPLMTALLVLSTRGVERETIHAPPKLNKARQKAGKPRIAPYERVYAEAYVTALQARVARRGGIPLGGTHASPVPHIRRGHMREYASGVTSFVRDSLVNFSEEAKQTAARSHYVVKGMG